MISSAPNRELRIELPTKAGHAYAIEFSDTLAPGSWRIIHSLHGDGAIHRLTLSDLGLSQTAGGYYRARTWLQPHRRPSD
jgi:hypothetical protein